MEIAVPWVQIFVLGVARVAAFIVQAPILGTSAVPTPIKAMLALVLSFFMMPPDAAGALGHALGWLPFLFLLVKETLVGWLMGVSLFLLLAAAFLLSDLASAITGEIMYVDGGLNTTALGNADPLPQQ